jgi:membrane protease YdiL (CAAX protease family)
LAFDGLWIALGVLEVVVVAVGEESIFRGILYRVENEIPLALAAVVSAAPFAFVHSYPPHLPAPEKRLMTESSPTAK